jgi:putative membrane protein
VKIDAGQRLPVKVVAAMSLHGAPSIVSLLIAGFLYWGQPGLWPGPVALYVIGVLLVLRLVSPIYAWAALRYEISEEKFSLTRGILFKTTRTTAWRDVSVVDIDSPWAFRQFGLGVVSLRSGGQDDAKIDVTGIDEANLEAIVEFARSPMRQGTQSGSGGEDNADNDPASGLLETSDRAVVYAARKRDLAAANLIYGHVVVLGTGAVLTAFDAIQQVANLDHVLEVFGSHPWISSVVLCGAVLLGGSVAAVVKYHGFTVSKDAVGLSIKYGWLSTNQRDIKPSAIGGIRARRNLIEMLLDRVRIALLTTDSDEQMGTNIVLPSMPRRQVKQLLTASLPELPKPAVLEYSGRGSIARSLILIVASAITVSGLGWIAYQETHTSPVLAAMTTIAFWYVLALAVRLAKARFSLAEKEIGWTSHAFVDHEVVLAASSLHLMSATGARTTNPIYLVQVHYFAGRPKTLTALTFSRLVRDQLRHLVVGTSSEIAAERRHHAVKQPTTEEFVHL